MIAAEETPVGGLERLRVDQAFGSGPTRTGKPKPRIGGLVARAPEHTLHDLRRTDGDDRLSLGYGKRSDAVDADDRRLGRNGLWAVGGVDRERSAGWSVEMRHWGEAVEQGWWCMAVFIGTPIDCSVKSHLWVKPFLYRCITTSGSRRDDYGSEGLGFDSLRLRH
jgi:hypothetical protein